MRPRLRRKIPARAALVAMAAVPAILLTFSPAAAAPAVDTSEWLCEFCPFDDGYRADISVGASSVSEDSAYVGDASGYDEEGLYLNADGRGSYAGDRYRASWHVEDLGLDSRVVEVDGGQPGTFDYALSYRELPRRQFNTTSTVFVDANGALSLPSNWVRGLTTDGFSTLGANLAGLDIGSDRSTLSAGGNYLPSNRWRISADYRRHQQDGVKVLGGSYYTNAALLPARIDYATDEFDLGVRYAGDDWAVAVSWYLSDFENGESAVVWQHPFSTLPGAEFAALAQPPDSQFQQLSLAGSYALPQYKSHVSFSAAVGEIEQDEAFLPYTTNQSLATTPLPRSALGGSVDTLRLAFNLSARPVANGRVKLSYRFDERDNGTSQETWNRVLADSFVSGDLRMNIPYGYERSTLTLTGDYDLLDTLRASAGYTRKDTERDFQEVAEQSEDDGWGRLRWRPHETLEVALKGGTAKRDIDRYNETLAVSFGQNPLMRKYNLAYRFREYGELALSYMPVSVPVTLTVKGYGANDSYTKSQLGMRSADEIRITADVSWTVSDNASVYLNGGIDNIASKQSGGQLPFSQDWGARFDDDFTTIGAGLRIRNIREKVDLQFDYTRSRGRSDINIDSTFVGSSDFPELETNLDYVRLALDYERSDRLSIDLNLRYQRFRAEDWSLEGVGPATMPSVLTLGAQPYSPEVYLVGIGFRYRIGEL